MKHIYTCILILSSSLIFAQAPITLSRADFPKPTSSSPMPDSVLYTNVIGATTTSQTTKGANQMWNESSLSGTTAYQHFVAVSATPLAFQLTFFGSDYAVPLDNAFGAPGGSATMQISDAYEYYNYTSNNSRLEIKGFGANITMPGQTTAIPLPAIYSSPDILFRFPMNFGDADSNHSGFDISLPLSTFGTIGFKREQDRVNEVDAWGTITTPAGTYTTLRHRSVITRIDSVTSSFINVGFPSVITEYRWLAQSAKIPILQINETNAITSVQTYTAFKGQGPNSIATSSEKNTLIAYPNPCQNQIHIDYLLEKPGIVSMYILDVMGKRIGQFQFVKNNTGLFSEILPLEHLANGSYFIQVVAGNEKSLIPIQKK
ncbi:MAG: T9SS type A sorting domain-containing protein [Chitinophagaceae bacterium]